MRSGGASGRCAKCATRPACLGAGLAGADLARLPELMARSNTLQPGEHLYRPGDAMDAHLYVRSGSFKTYTTNTEGDERITGFYLPGEVLSCTVTNSRRIDGAIALETASACRINNNDIVQLQALNRLPRFFQSLSQREKQLVDHQLNLSNPSAQARFAGFCLQYSDRLLRLGRCPSILHTPMSRTDIASYLGMTLESLSRVTSRLNKVGLIRATRRQIELLDRATLRTLTVQNTG